MRVIRIQIESLMVKVALTRAEEARCDDCARLSAQLVEALLSGDVQNEELLGIVHHLEECFPCAQEFAILQDCVMMEQYDSWPTMEEMWQKLDEGK